MAETSAESLLLKPAEVAAHLRISLRSAQRLIKSEAIPKVLIKGSTGKSSTRVRREDLEAYIAGLPTGPTSVAS